MFPTERLPQAASRGESTQGFFQAIFDSIGQAILVIDIHCRIVALNDAAESMLKTDRAGALGRCCADVLHPTECDDACPFRRVCASGESLENCRFQLQGKRGEAIGLRASITPLMKASGSPSAAVAMLHKASTTSKASPAAARIRTNGCIIGSSRPMRKLIDQLPDVAASESTVLIQGESGTGKELFARAVHDLSPRHGDPYVVVNCGALPETLLESELFGYRKGAFTDARRNKPGRFDLASGGTIVLDEVEALTPSMQVKLLRVIENREYQPLGGNEALEADVRIVATSNRPLESLLQLGKFRDDLFYRLHVVTLDIPPLRQRIEDIPVLIDHFVDRLNCVKAKRIRGLSAAARHALMAYAYPGNVRELENAIEHAFVMCRDGVIGISHLPARIDKCIAATAPPWNRGDDTASQASPLAAAEAAAIRAALAHNAGHRRRTADELGVSPVTLWRKMNRYGIKL